MSIAHTGIVHPFYSAPSMNTPASVSSVPASLTLHGQIYTVAVNTTWAKYNSGTPDRFDIYRDGELLINTVSADEVRERGLGSLLPAPVVAPMPADPFVAPAPGGRVVSVCNEHVLNEWARMATQAYKAGHNEIGHKFSAAATISLDTRVCPKWFDSMQDVYRAWLVFGWTDAVPAFQKAFPAVSA